MYLSSTSHFLSTLHSSLSPSISQSLFLSCPSHYIHPSQLHSLTFSQSLLFLSLFLSLSLPPSLSMSLSISPLTLCFTLFSLSLYLSILVPFLSFPLHTSISDSLTYVLSTSFIPLSLSLSLPLSLSLSSCHSMNLSSTSHSPLTLCFTLFSLSCPVFWLFTPKSPLCPPSPPPFPPFHVSLSLVLSRHILFIYSM